MVVKTQGTTAAQLERSIECIKYTLFCLSAVMWVSDSFFNCIVGIISDAYLGRFTGESPRRFVFCATCAGSG